MRLEGVVPSAVSTDMASCPKCGQYPIYKKRCSHCGSLARPAAQFTATDRIDQAWREIWRDCLDRARKHLERK